MGGPLRPDSGNLRWDAWLNALPNPVWNWCFPTSNYCPKGVDSGGGGYDLELPVIEPKLSYESQNNPNRMTGNWWFPYDVFVVAQPNGDLNFFGPESNGLTYVWDAVALTFTSPSGFFDKMVANANGTWTRTTKSGMVWQFNAGGHLVSITSRYGLSTQINRNAQQAITSIVDFAGRATAVAYNAQGRVASLTDWSGRATSFTYTAQGYLQSITKPATTFFDRATGQVVTRSKVQTFTYQSGTGTALDGNLLTGLEDRGNTGFSFTYDAADRATQMTSSGQTWTVTYNPTSTRVVDPDGVTIEYSFNGAGAIARKEVFTQTGLGNPPLRPGEPTSYVWLYQRTAVCGCDLITKITFPDGSTRSLTYDTWGNITSEIFAPAPGTSGDTIKRTWTFSSFALYCRLLTHTTPNGFAAGASAADYTYTYARDAKGNVTSMKLPKAEVAGALQHTSISFTFNSTGQMLTRTLADGTATDYEYYSPTLRLKKVTRDPGGLNLTRTFVWDTVDRLASETDGLGNTTSYSYNALDELISILGPQPLAAEQKFLYDNNGNLYQQEVENLDSSGAVIAANPWFTTTLTHDINDRLSSIVTEIDASTTATTSMTFTPGGRISTVTDANGEQVKSTYDERGLPFTVISGYGTPIAGTTTSSYDLNGNVSSIVDPLGNATSLEYDHVARLTKITYADGAHDKLEYDLSGNITKSEKLDTGGVVRARSTVSFDPFGLLVSSSRHHLDASGVTTTTDDSTVSRDSVLRVTTLTNAAGNSSTITYDAVGRPATQQSPTLDRVEQDYDAAGNATVARVKSWNQTTSAYDTVIIESTYDALYRVTQAKRKDLGATIVATTSQTYDGRGLPLTTTDPLGNTSHRTWDGRGLLLTLTRDLRAGGVGAGSVSSTIVESRSYDAGGRLISIANGLSNATAYTFDARSRATKVTDPSGAQTVYVYDLAGNPTSRTDPLGTVVTNTFDTRNRLTARAIQRATGVLGTTAESLTYDGIGRRTLWSDDDSTVTWAFDAAGRLASETAGANPLGSTGKTFSFGYDAVGALLSITYPDATVVSHGRDASNRLSTVSVAGIGTIGTYSYSGSRILSVGLTNSVTKSFSYDAVGRHTLVEYTKSSTSIKKFEYSWNLADKRLLEKRHHATGSGDNYTLDSLYRTISVKEGVADPVAELATPGSQTLAQTSALTYDAGNSRTQRVVTVGATPTTTNYTVDTLEFYTAVGGTTNVRDANGNLTDDGTNLYSYDYRNRLVRVNVKSGGAVVATYEYDSMSRRISKTVAAGTTTFSWIGAQLAMEYSGATVISRRHYGDAMGEVLLATQKDYADLDGDGSVIDQVSTTPMYDGAFDCVGVLGPAGALAESYTFTFDGTISITNAGGQTIGASAIGWYQGYGRGYRDAETGLVYNLNRYYDPSTARFITTDPAGTWFDRGALGNGYAWVGNGFRNSWDPFGLEDIAVDVAAGSIQLAAVDTYSSLSSEERAEPIVIKDYYSKVDGGVDASTTIGRIVWAMRIVELTVNGLEGEDEIRPGTQQAQTDHLEGNKYQIDVNMSHWRGVGKKKSHGERMFLMFHEVMHAALAKCGLDYIPAHHRARRRFSLFNRKIFRIFSLLRKYDERDPDMFPDGMNLRISEEDWAELDAKYGRPR